MKQGNGPVNLTKDISSEHNGKWNELLETYNRMQSDILKAVHSVEIMSLATTTDLLEYARWFDAFWCTLEVYTALGGRQCSFAWS